MHEVAMRPEIIERVLARRGRLHLYEQLDPRRTGELPERVRLVDPVEPARTGRETVDAMLAALVVFEQRLLRIAHGIPGSEASQFIAGVS